MSGLIRLENVSKSFKGRRVLSDVNFSISTGDVVAIMGCNGSGKSVLLRLMCRLLVPDVGVVHIDPHYLDPKQTFPRRFGVIIDRPGFIPSLSGIDNLRRLADIQKLIGDEDIRRAMELVQLDPHLPQPVAKYSLGMKQKLALAQSFMEGQEVLILDEPFNALDRSSITAVFQLLQTLIEQGKTLVFTSHSEEHVQFLARRVLEIDAQTVVETIAPAGGAS